MNIKNIVIGTLLVLIVVAITLFYQKRNDSPEVEGRNSEIKVTASFYPLYYFSERIVGDRGEVTNITPAGAEPHDYEPTAKDFAKIEKSDVVVLSGGNFESWGKKIKNTIDPSRTLLIEVGAGLTTRDNAKNTESGEDPHVWLSPKLAEIMVERILEALVQVDPGNASYYRENADALKKELNKLDTEYTIGLNNCANRNFITSHAAFGRLASAYNLNQIAITGISPDSEPSARKLAEVIKFAKEHSINYIFFEELVSPKLSETVAREIGGGVLPLNPLEGLTKKDLSEGKNYFIEMENNLTNLKKALQCTQ